MLDEVKPDIVWAFVENNRHLEIAKACATRHINLIFEKPLAANYSASQRDKGAGGKEWNPGDDQLPNGLVAGKLRG